MSRPSNVLPSPVESAPLPEVINHTPWPSQYIQHIDQHGEIFHVMISRMTYSLVGMRCEDHQLPTPELVDIEDQSPLCEADEYIGKVSETSVLQESDYAPYKPKCDVLLINACAYAPEGKPAKRWAAGFRLGELRKQLQVTGPRTFKRSVISLGMLSLTEPQEAIKVPLTYELAYGGPNILDSKMALERLQADMTLDVSHREEATIALQNLPDLDAFNPIGCGRLPTQIAQAFDSVTNIIGQGSEAQIRTHNAQQDQTDRQGPQIEAFQRPYKGEDGEGDYPVIGVGPIARWWQPRRQLAGTYDAAWKQTQWPKSPMDHDYRYWNCAPEDQQIDYPTGGEEIILANLTPAGSPVRFQLPTQDLQLLVRLDVGAMMFAPMHIDTVTIDFATSTLSIVRRALVGARAGVRQLELGTWPAGTSMQVAAQPQQAQEQRHGAAHG